MRQQILLVEPDEVRAQPLAAALQQAGFAVVSASGFEDALSHLRAGAIGVLITAVRLGPYNGVHLILRGRAQDARLPAVLTVAEADPVLQADAAAFGAEYVVAPWTDTAALLRTVSRLIHTEPI